MQNAGSPSCSEGDTPTLFVWRESCSFFDEADEGAHLSRDMHRSAIQEAENLYGEFTDRCPFCGSTYGHPHHYFRDPEACRYCGFHYESAEHTLLGDRGENDWYDQVEYRLAALRKLDVNSAELTLAELGSHLRRRYRDIYHLHWRIFETLIEDIYRALGYRTRLTRMSRDNGYDIMLLEGSSGDQVIVECKRYKEGRRVGIEVVDRLLGVQLRLRTRRAKLVTSTTFTSAAKIAARQAKDSDLGYELELVDVSHLVQALQVYNVLLPPLHLLVSQGRGLSAVRGGAESNASPRSHGQTGC